MLDKKKSLLATVAVGAVFAMSGSALAETLKVYWNAGHAYDTYAGVIEQFEADNPGWEVQWERFQWPDMRTKLVADLAIGETPDLVAEPGGWVQEFALQGLIEPLDDYIARDGAEMGYPSDWQDFAVQRNMIDGSYYGVQIHLTCGTLVYNEDMLMEAGFDAPPSNWEQFREVAIATAKPGRFGFAPNSSVGYHWAFILQAGADYYDPETNRVTLDSPEAAEGLQFLADLIHKDKAAPLPATGADYEGPRNLFVSERAAMIITGPWDVTPIRTGNPELNWKIAPSLKGDRQATFSGGVSLFIPKDAKHKDMAWDLMQRFVSLEAEIEASLANGMTMPRKSWGQHPDVLANEVLGEFGKCLNYAVDVGAQLRLTGQSARIDELYKQAVETVLYNNEPAAEVLAEMAVEANALLAENQ